MSLNHSSIKYTVILFLSVIVPVEVISQESIFTYYNTDKGLPSNEVYHVIQDQLGYIWLSTDNGVSRFNGYEFKNYSTKDGLEDNVIFFMYEDQWKRIWFISYNNKLSYYQNGQIYSYKYNHLITKELKARGKIIKTSFYLDSLETLHFGTHKKGEFRINKNGHIEHLYPNTTYLININDNKITTSGTDNATSRSLKILEDGITKYHTNFLPDSYNKNWNVSLKLTDDHYLFSSSKFIRQFKNDKESIYEFGSQIPWMSQDKNSNLWVSLFRNGIFRYKDSKLTSTPIHYLKGETISSVFSDKNNAIWMTTLNGVYFFPNLKIETIKSDLSKDKNVTNLILENNNTLWFSTSDASIYKKEKQTIQIFPSKERHYISNLDFDYLNNKILFSGSSFGYIKDQKRVNINKIKVENPIRKNAHITAFKRIINSSKNHYWYLDYNGAGKIEKDFSSVKKIISDTLVSKGHCLYELKDNELLIGCKDGLWHYQDSKYRLWNSSQALLKKRIDIITKDDNGNFWLASKGNGIIVLNKDTCFLISEDHGLSSSFINSVYPHQNDIWVGTINGLCKISLKDVKVSNYSIQQFYKHHGLASNIINDIVIKNDTAFVATSNGISYYHTKDLKIDTSSSPLFIQNIKILEKDTTILNEYILNHHQNSILIEYIGLNYRKAGKLWYRYKLSGINKDWVETQNRIVRYPSLPPGKYTFEVSVKSENGTYRSNSLKIRFIINPPFWETWWFIMLLITLIIWIAYSFIAIIHRIKLKEIKKRAKLFENITRLRQEALAQQMNPHFIFNSLSSIQYYISQNDKAASSKYLRMFSQLMRITLNNSSKKSISLSEELEALAIYIQLEQVRLDHSFDYKIDINPEINISTISIPSLLLQPFVENSIRHGLSHKKEADKKLTIKISIIEKKLICIIKDNGIGRKASKEINKHKKHKSLGSKITESRLKLINLEQKNNLTVNYNDIFSEEGKACGTEVQIIIPYKKTP